ncbi:tetratricopeptide repeat-containing sensor histidine kinase [Olleya namhaensis]|uniref:tetratricopeptide repeat-containing sensor histidine kinase n=1 Tax=Olleya namhaensis TaxID=1144750 RepID=UPI0024930F26|nr:ATP-binding protein [Olleya namhaensis]
MRSRIEYAQQAVMLSKSKEADSTILNSNKSLSKLYLIKDDFKPLKSINIENLELAKKIKDSFAIADAYYILGYIDNLEAELDSAYEYFYKAYKVYRDLKNYEKEAELLYNMASIQLSERDFIGAEINAIKAKLVVEKLPKTDNNLDTLWSIHNLIATISAQLQLYDKALEYNDLAVSYANTISNQNRYYDLLYSNTNIASVYRRKGLYPEAKEKYLEILEDEGLKAYDLALYAVINANLAYTTYLIDPMDASINSLFIEALHNSKKANDDLTTMSIGAYFAEYLNAVGKQDSAKYYNDLSYKMAKKINVNEYILQTLITKASINKDSARSFLMEHIKLSDSLVLAERSIRNKFARIELETAEIVEENQEMSRQRLYLIITSIGLLMVLLFLYILKTQREKNKELQLERQQQEANQEIYGLMLSQQDNIDEARKLEKNRISKDIHDGILGKLFGVRLSLDSLNLSVNTEAIDKRSHYINELKNIEDDIRKVSHDLNTDFIKKAGFLDIVKTLVETQMEAYKIAFSFIGDDSINWDALDNTVKIHLYRILQETMQNAYKHAQATKVVISYKKEDTNLVFNITDDGEGFDMYKSKKGIGLKNIEDRVQEIKGKLLITSQKQKGTDITIIVPIFTS